MAARAYVLAGLAAAAAGLAGWGLMMKPRSVRNNNPGNIVRTSVEWKGMTAVQTDDRFVTFERPLWGFRAMARVLQAYRERGLDTVREIIMTWAPSHENDTDAYIEAVAERMGVDPDERLQLGPESPQLHQLIRAIAIHETGYFAWTDDELRAGVHLA